MADVRYCQQEIATGEPMTANQIRDMLRRRITYEFNQSALAAELRISNGHLSDILAGKKEPGDKVIAALGLEVDYRRIRSTKGK